MTARRFFAMVILIALSTLGCGRQEQVIPERRPRPVTVATLVQQRPPNAAMVSASVGSWKTEEIGFEVGGRVEFVVEPNTEIEGRIFDKEGNMILKGTPIGRIESERYALQVAKAEADVKRAEQNLLAAQTDLDENIPAQIAAATANRDLAKTEFERSQRLFARNAGSAGDVDRDRANYQSAEAQLKQLGAAAKAKSAEIESLESAKLQAEQNLRDAKRNLEDCTVYSSFRGQIAATSVVPGSVVTAGQPIATIQMMDPIKVEVEVSAEVSRRLQERERLPVEVTMPDGSQEIRDGYLYLIDSTADPLTRTFTVTLLVMNEKISDLDVDENVATTNDIWRLDFQFLPGAEKNMLFVAEQALLQDDDGYYLWMITNMTIRERTPPGDHRLKVRKLRVTPMDFKVPYLGNWVFQHIVVNDQEFDPKVNMVVGKLNVGDEDPADWQGDTVVRTSGGQWMLRPGDLVRVDLAGGNVGDGYFVPMDAITRKQGQAYLFGVADSEGKKVAKRIPISLVGDFAGATTSSLRRILPTESSSLDGTQYVVKGAHYLIDGEPVIAATQQEASE